MAIHNSLEMGQLLFPVYSILLILTALNFNFDKIFYS